MPLIPLDLLDNNYQARPFAPTPQPSQVTLPMIAQAIALPFQPSRTQTLNRYDDLAELDVDFLTHKLKYRAMILNVLGPVVKDYRESPRAEIVEKIGEINKKMLLCLLPERNQPVPEELLKMGIPVAYSVTPKNDNRCYETVSNIYIRNRNPNTTPIQKSEHLVVGSNFLTDLVCRDVDMDYIYVTPQRGIESRSFDLLRSFAEKVVSVHDYLRRLKAVYHPIPERQINTSYSNPYTTPYSRGQYSQKRYKVTPL